MGCGKTTVGRVLAVQGFVDLDEEIERREGVSVQEIFRTRGEGAFRALESSVLRDLLSCSRWPRKEFASLTPPPADAGGPPASGPRAARPCEASGCSRQQSLVIALGGGTLTNPQCRELLKENDALCIYLRASVETLASHLSSGGDLAARPLLAGPGTIEEKISGLLSLRSGLYESSADFILDTDGLSQEQIAGQIRRIVSRRYRAVIFDLDGTLLDTLEDLACAVEHALQKRGFPGHSIQEYRGMVGHGVRNLVIRALPGQLQENQELVDACLSDFKDYYRSHIDVHTHPYPGMPELLGRLRQEGVRLCVASNKFQEGVEHLVKEFFPDITFSAILGDRPGKALKPDPQIVREALAAAGVDVSDCVMAGDSATDMKTAAAAGIDAIAVNWGYRSLEASPDYLLVHSAEELGMALL